MAWNPFASRTEVRREVPSSDGAAAVYARTWSAREQLTYEDSLTQRFIDMQSLTSDAASTGGTPTDASAARSIRIATMRLVATTLTLTRAEGFPDAPPKPKTDPETGEALLDGEGNPIPDGPPEPFDPSNERHLLALDGNVYRELVAIATDVQPLPGLGGDKAAAAPSGEAGGEPEDDDDASDDLTDPFPTPSTPPVESAPAKRRRSQASTPAS